MPRSSNDPPAGETGGDPTLPDASPGGAPGDDPAPSDDREPGDDSELSDEERRRRRRTLILLLTPLSLAVVAGFVASALTPTLLARHPLALIALDARNRNLILTASLVDPVPFYLVATARLLAVDPFTYLLGRKYGDAGVRWIERRFTGLKPTVEWLELVFAKAAPVAVALAPGAVICTLAGAAGMRVGVFFVANILGTVGRLVALRLTGEAFSGPVDVIRRFFDRYIVWTTLASIALVALWLWFERRQGAAEAETVGELADELETEIEESEGHDDQ